MTHLGFQYRAQQTPFDLCCHKNEINFYQHVFYSTNNSKMKHTDIKSFGLSEETVMTNVDCNSLVSKTYCRTQKPMCYNFVFGNLYLLWQSIHCKDFWLSFNTSGLQCRAWSVSPSIPRLWHWMPHFSWDPNVDAMPAQTPYGSNAKQHIKNTAQIDVTNKLAFWICGLSLQADVMIRMLGRGKYMQCYWSTSQTWYSHMRMRHAKSAFWTTTQLFSKGP